MATTNPNAHEVLRGEILDEARRQKEDILKRARQEAESLLAKTSAEAEQARQERLGAARQEAARRKEAILATVPVEAGRLSSARVEAVLEGIHEKIRARLQARDGFVFRETVTLLAAKALSKMAGDAFVMKLSAADHLALGERLAEDTRRGITGASFAITILKDATITNGEIIIQDVEGRQAWNIGLLARLERLWPELRRRIAVQTSLVSGGSSAGGGA